MHLYVGADGYLIGCQEREGARLHVASDTATEDAWRDCLAGDGAGDGVRPEAAWADEDGTWRLRGDHAPGVAISPEGLAILWEEKERTEEGAYRLGPRGRKFVECSLSFRAFLDLWYFESNEKNVVMLLGPGLWAGQDKVVAAMEEYLRAFFLKARRLGETTLGVAFDAWVLRFRPNCRVHLVSRIEKDSKEQLLQPLKFGLARLPEEFQLSEVASTTTSLELDAGRDDRRIVAAYPAKEPGRGYGATHVHLDELAAMMETSPDLPEDVWKAIGPTINAGSSFHIFTTGKGPGFYAEVWENALKTEGKPDEEGLPTMYPCFIGATGSRPDYTPARIKRERAEFGAWEYPERWEEAIAGKDGNYFTSYEIDWAKRYARPYLPPIYVRDREHRVTKTLPHGKYTDVRGREHMRRFVKAWDIGGPGETSDASCGILLDVSEVVWDARKIVYLQGYEYPQQARFIEQLHWDYPGDTWIEDNNAGEAVRSFLDLPMGNVHGWQTTRQSKGVAIHALKIGLQYRLIKWDPAMENANILEAEMRKYQLKDEGIKQDTVMALAIAVAVAPEVAASTAGRVIRLFGGGLTM